MPMNANESSHLGLCMFDFYRTMIKLVSKQLLFKANLDFYLWLH